MKAAAVWRALVVVIVALLGPAFSVSAQPAGTLVVGLVAEPVNLDPAQVTDLNSSRVGRRTSMNWPWCSMRTSPSTITT